MRIRLVIGLLLVAAPGAGAQAPPASQPAPTSFAATSQPGADDDLRRQFEELRARMATLEAEHAAEREQDRKRIAELEARVTELQDPSRETARLEAMRRQIAEIRLQMARDAGQIPASAPGGPPATGAEAELQSLLAGAAPAPVEARAGGPLGAIQGAIQSMNPDISINGDFLGMWRSHEGGHPQRKFDFRELEIGFSGAVDPYTRADIIATVGDDNTGEYSADLEEAYVTFLQLPYNLQARVGKFRSEFGRANPIHLHALPWTDYPLVIQRYFGEEGLSGTGAELSWLVPDPWKQYISLTYEITNNDNDTLFAGDQADDVTHLVRLKTFRDLSPASTLEMGASFATGPDDHGHGSHRSMVEGLDFTYRWKPKGAGLYRSFLWQTELMAAQADIRGGEESTWGMYSAAEYQFARRWKLGARYDYTQLPFESSLHEHAYSAYLTFLQSEFLFWRLAYVYIDRNFRDEGVTDEQRLMLQVNFTLGTHPAHKY